MLETLIGIGRSIIPNAYARALALKVARQAATWISGFVLAWLVSHGIDSADANGIAGVLGSLAVFGVSAFFNWYDAHSVDRKITNAKAQGVAEAVAKGAVVPAPAIPVAPGQAAASALAAGQF